MNSEVAELLAKLKRMRLLALVVAAVCVPVGLTVIVLWLSWGRPVGLLIGGIPIVGAVATAVQASRNLKRFQATLDEYTAKHGAPP